MPKSKEERNQEQWMQNDVDTLSTTASLFESPLRLQKDLNFAEAVGVMIGSMIGSTIFIHPSLIVTLTGSVYSSLIIWLLAGIVSMMIALSYTELSLLFPAAGAEYVYIRLIVGKTAGFIYAWFFSLWLLPATLAYHAFVTAEFALKSLFLECNIPPNAHLVASIAIILFVCAVNCYQVQVIAVIQTLLSILKYLSLLILIGVGFFLICSGEVKNLRNGFEGSSTDSISLLHAMFYAMFAYNGWQSMFCLVEETKNPRAITKITLTTFILVIIAYVAINVAIFAVMSPEYMANSEVVAMTFIGRTIGGYSYVILIAVAVSSLGSLNGIYLGGVRVIYAAARDFLFPDILSTLNIHNRCPLPAVLFTALTSSLYLIFGEPQGYINSLGLSTLFISFTIMCLLLIYRERKPSLYRPTKVLLILPILSLAICLALISILLYTKPTEHGLGTIILLSGIPVYILFFSCSFKTKKTQGCIDKFYKVIQKILLTAPEDDY